MPLAVNIAHICSLYQPKRIIHILYVLYMYYTYYTAHISKIHKTQFNNLCQSLAIIYEFVVFWRLRPCMKVNMLEGWVVFRVFM